MAALLNLSEADFEITTPGYLADLLEAQELRWEREYKYSEYQTREAWEQTRLLAWYNVQMQIEKKDRQSVKKFMPLPWDAPEVVNIEEMRELARSSPWINANLETTEPGESTPEEVESSINTFLVEWQQSQT